MEYKEHLKKLRILYVKATTKQRIRAAEDRLNYPDCNPNKLLQIVSAVEGLARAIVLKQNAATKEELDKEYKRIKLWNPVKLIEDAICPNIKQSPSEFLSTETWTKFKYSVDYRNLLIHECTFLDGAIAKKMIQAAEETFNKLKELA